MTLPESSSPGRRVRSKMNGCGSEYIYGLDGQITPKEQAEIDGDDIVAWIKKH